jgi:hypothetical protein
LNAQFNFFGRAALVPLIRGWNELVVARQDIPVVRVGAGLWLENEKEAFTQRRCKDERVFPKEGFKFLI